MILFRRLMQILQFKKDRKIVYLENIKFGSLCFQKMYIFFNLKNSLKRIKSFKEYKYDILKLLKIRMRTQKLTFL